MGEVTDPTGGAGQGTESLWDDWETPLRTPSSPALHLDGFDGPLDLLLDLVERKRIDLQRMSPLAMVEQFAAAMERYAADVPLERRADWLVMVARLVLLRSRLCFPASPEEQQAAERQVRDTRRQLDGRRAVRTAANWLDARPQLGRDVFARPVGVSPRVSSYMDLMDACLAVLLREEELEQRQAGAWATTLTVRPASPYELAAIIASIRERLGNSEAAEQLGSLAPPVPPKASDPALASRMALSVTLSAVLELARTGELTLSQEQDGTNSRPVFVRARRGVGAIDLPMAAEMEQN